MGEGLTEPACDRVPWIVYLRMHDAGAPSLCARSCKLCGSERGGCGVRELHSDETERAEEKQNKVAGPLLGNCNNVG